MFPIDRPAARLLGLALFCGACATVEAPVPQGFAGLEAGEPLEAVTPDALIYRVRQAANEPRADLAFWRKALKQRMDEAGYIFVAEREVKAAAVPGYLLELAAPLGEKDFGYLVVVFVRGEDLTLVEAAGEVSRLRRRRAEIVKAIEGIRWN
jgi:hypothetical protein